MCGASQRKKVAAVVVVKDVSVGDVLAGVTDAQSHADVVVDEIVLIGVAEAELVEQADRAVVVAVVPLDAVALVVRVVPDAGDAVVADLVVPRHVIGVSGDELDGPAVPSRLEVAPAVISQESCLEDQSDRSSRPRLAVRHPKGSLLPRTT